MKRIDRPEDRWTHWYKSENTVSQLDYILLSPRLNDITDGNIPTIERRGIGMREFLKNGKPAPKKTKFFESEDGTKTEISFQFDRFEGVNKNDFASDHCAVFFDIP
jgi:hypothetical protein